MNTDIKCKICKEYGNENEFSYYIPGSKVWNLRVCDYCFTEGIRDGITADGLAECTHKLQEVK